jgi:hypothetical protein
MSLLNELEPREADDAGADAPAPAPAPLDEMDCRRPDFGAGTPVILADGQAWQLRRPVVRFVPDDGDERGYRTLLALPGDPRFADLAARREALFAAGGGARLAEVAGIELAIGKALLLANYDLTAVQVAELLQFGYDPDTDPEGAVLRDLVMDLAEGRPARARRPGDADAVEAAAPEPESVPAAPAS